MGAKQLQSHAESFGLAHHQIAGVVNKHHRKLPIRWSDTPAGEPQILGSVDSLKLQRPRRACRRADWC